MSKILYTSPSSKNNQNRLIIKKKDLNQVNDEILNHQNFYDLIEYFKNEKINIGKEIDQIKMNIISKSYLKENNSKSLNKLKKDIRHICKFIYNDKNTIDNNKENKIYINEYNMKNKSLKPVKPFKFSKSKDNKTLNYSKENYQIKESLNEDRDNITNNCCQTIENERMRNNIIDYIPEQKNKNIHIKLDYGNYAYSNTNFKHPQFYILKNNSNNNINTFSKNSMDKLPIIENPFGIKIRRADLSYLVPKDKKKIHQKEEFYNYYIGKKLIKNKFNY